MTTKLLMYDRLEFDDAAKVRFLDDGRMTAMPRVARTGIQIYLGKEVGMTGADANKIVRVYRPEDEVFNPESMQSFTHKAVTNDHPPEHVTADNFKKFAVGWTGDEVARDGQAFRVPMMVADAKAVADYKAGKRELSNGYSCELKFGDGVSPQGEAYDAIQTNIRGNHVAIVDAARGGSSLRIGDNETRSTMNDRTMGTLMIDGAPLQVDAMVAGVIQAHINRLTASAADTKTLLDKTAKELEEEKQKFTKKDAEATAAIATKDAEIATLNKKVTDSAITPAQLDAMVAERTTVIGKAKTVMGDKASTLVVDGKTVADIKKQLVDGHLGAEVTKDWTTVHYDAAFASITKDVKPGEQRTEDSVNYAAHGYRGGGSGPGVTVADAARVFGQQVKDERSDAYDSYDKEQADAWRRKPAAAAA
jgi:hypothetical protein